MSLRLARRLAREAARFDPIADRLQPRLRDVLSRSPRLRNALDGRPLGAPLHPALTDVVIGAWTTALVLDALEDDRSRNGPTAGDAALAVGVLAALPTALTGLSDWTHLKGERRRLGSAHAVLNGSGLALNAASIVLRARGRRGAGKALSTAGFALAALAAHLGGQLSFGLGARVNSAMPADEPADFAPVLSVDELDGDALCRAELDGDPILLARAADGTVCAIGAVCSHMGGPLDEGERDADTVVCPWHESRFDLRTGDVVDAPAVFPQPRYETRVENGTISVRVAPGP